MPRVVIAKCQAAAPRFNGRKTKHLLWRGSSADRAGETIEQFRAFVKQVNEGSHASYRVGWYASRRNKNERT